MKKTYRLMAGTLLCLSLCCSAVRAAVTAEEARQLGGTLTLFGAEREGNADKTIPAYTGGLTTIPPGFQSNVGLRPDPFAADKPVYAITQANLAEHEKKLSAGTRELLTRYPKTMRVDVYPTHRPVAYPKYVLDNTVKNATSAKTTDGGVGIEGTYAGLPFPIPKTGNEVMWNHLLRYQGLAYQTPFDSYSVDASGRLTLGISGEYVAYAPYYDPKRTGVSKPDDVYWMVKVLFNGPPRRAGEALMSHDFVNQGQYPRRAWQYLPGQRRVKMAPELSYDTPNPGTSGLATFDDTDLFNGSMDRYDFKLVGKREMVIPYSAFKAVYTKEKPEVFATPNHANPDFQRWELHRVWVVEATLKPGKRHIYAKRVFYVDEDTWIIAASDQYDSRGQLFRGGFASPTAYYDTGGTSVSNQTVYDFNSGGYAIQGIVGRYKTGVIFSEPLPAAEWSPENLAGTGIR